MADELQREAERRWLNDPTAADAFDAAHKRGGHPGLSPPRSGALQQLTLALRHYTTQRLLALTPDYVTQKELALIENLLYHASASFDMTTTDSVLSFFMGAALAHAQAGGSIEDLIAVEPMDQPITGPFFTQPAVHQFPDDV